jgi:hypothetical protein
MVLSHHFESGARVWLVLEKDLQMTHRAKPPYHRKKGSHVSLYEHHPTGEVLRAIVFLQ